MCVCLCVCLRCVGVSNLPSVRADEPIQEPNLQGVNLNTNPPTRSTYGRVHREMFKQRQLEGDWGGVLPVAVAILSNFMFMDHISEASYDAKTDRFSCRLSNTLLTEIGTTFQTHPNSQSPR